MLQSINNYLPTLLCNLLEEAAWQSMMIKVTIFFFQPYPFSLYNQSTCKQDPTVKTAHHVSTILLYEPDLKSSQQHQRP